MPVELLVSAPATGKTETCIRKIRSIFSAQPLAKIWIVLPDRLQAESFRNRLAASGGALGAYAGRFEDLYQNILEHAGLQVPTASSPLIYRLIQETVDIAISNQEISHYATLQTMPGFILALRDSFAELKRSLIYPERILEFTQDRLPAERELAILYTRYQARLQALNWADPEELSWQAIRTIERQAEPAMPIHLLVVDGFDSFTEAQRRILKLLAGQVGDMLISLPGGSNRPAHRRFVPELKALENLSARISKPDNPPYLPPDIFHLENNIFETSAAAIALTTSSPFLLAARSPAEEAREALRWIKAQVIRNKLALNECAIFTPNPDVYHAWLRAAAGEFGIPVRFTKSERLDESPAIRAFINLLSLPAQNYAIRPLFNCLRSPYFHFRISSQDVDDLENISRAACIVEGRSQWEDTWDRLALTDEQISPDLDEERDPGSLPTHERLLALRDALSHFFILSTPPEGFFQLQEWITWLENLLDALQFYLNATSERDIAACVSLQDALRAMLLSETVAGKLQINYSQFLASLQGTLDGVGLPEPVVGDQSALLIGSMQEARGVRYKAVALMGLSEGLFPVVERADPFLGEDLRRELNLETRLEREQAGLFYQAITRAEQALLITRPYLSDDGENWEPSPFWKAAENLFTGSAVQTIRPDDPRPLSEAASAQEVLFWAVRRKNLPGRYAVLLPRWEALRHAREIIRARRAKAAQGEFEGSTGAITPQLVEKYSAAHEWSASRLESYGTCPQMFYVTNVLELNPRELPELGLDASKAGTILHRILEQIYRRAANPADPQTVLALLPQVAKEVFAEAPEKYGFRPSPLWQMEQDQFLNALQLTVMAMAEQSQDWIPFAFEQIFGSQGHPSLVINLGEEMISLHGIIDRLDRNSEGLLRVIDYKTGGSHLAQSDLKDGRRLQLPIYALAARDALGLGEPSDGFYWKIMSAEASSLKLAKFKDKNGQGPEAAYQVAREHLLRIIRGIRSGDFPPTAPKDGCPSYCPAAQWCWRYAPGW